MTGAVAFRGIEAVHVETQVKLLPGLPSFIIVGLPDKVVAESRERIRSAISSMGLSLPLKKIIVNLSPAEMAKEGSHYDLPIAVALLVEMGIINIQSVRHTVMMGELTLDGDVIRVNGILPAAALAKNMGHKLICPWVNGHEAALIEGLDVLTPQNLLQLINHFNGSQSLPCIEAPDSIRHGTRNDFSINDIKGHVFAKRAAEVAIAGGHHILMIGSPGSGKSMLARRMVGLMPPMSYQEAIEVSMIRSIAGDFSADTFSMQRPYRDPHHSCSMVAMIGGGKYVKPGEVSLAHNGILFLDELPEFSRPTLEALRQPIETKTVTIARAETHVTYPANFQLICAMNPCRCGYAGTDNVACADQAKCMHTYMGRISGPMLDRIDICIYMEPVDIFAYVKNEPDNDGTIIERIIAARAIQFERYQADGIRYNAHAQWTLLQKYAMPNNDGIRMVKDLAKRRNLSTRAINKVFQVARTIADLNGKIEVCSEHIAEAVILGARDIMSVKHHNEA